MLQPKGACISLTINDLRTNFGLRHIENTESEIGLALRKVVKNVSLKRQDV